MLTKKERDDLEKGKPSWKFFLIAFSYLFAMIPVFLYQYHKNVQRKAIRQNAVVTKATIIRLEYRRGKGRGWYWTYATYRVGGVRFSCAGRAFATLTPNQRDSLIGLMLPVVYEKVNPANGELLSGEGRFNRFSLDFPDSLAWTRSYFLE